MNLLSTTLATATIAGASLLTGNSSAFLANSNTAHATKSATRANVQLASKETPTPAPAPQPKVVTVQPGDYLTKLADENQTTSLRLFYANTDISNPDLIYPNQQVRIPEADETLTPREVPVNQQIATPTPATATAQAAPTVSSAPTVAGSSVWDSLAACESGGNWAINTGNGFYGGLQFTLGSWQAVGGSGMPNQASREEQIMRGQMLQSRGGWGNWPACSAKLGLY